MSDSKTDGTRDGVSRGVCPGGVDSYRDINVVRHSEMPRIVCPHQEEGRSLLFRDRVSYDMEQVSLSYAVACTKAREHLEAAEKGGDVPVGERWETGLTIDGHIRMAEAWSRYALAVKP